MNHNFENQNDEQLEQLLKTTLTPQKAGWQVDREVLEAILLKDKKQLRRSRYLINLRYGWIGALGLAAAVAITFVYFTQLKTDPDGDLLNKGDISPIQFGPPNANIASSESLQYRAIGGSKKLIGVEDNGWTHSDEDSVTRELKYDYIDTVDFVNEEDGSVMRMQIPRQEIVNVTYQVI